jgi:hypothetical protein
LHDGRRVDCAAALAAALVVAGDHAWPARRWTRVAALTLAIGVAYTVYSEHLNADVRRSWTYSGLMPRLPLLGTGLSPIVQWVVVPVAALVWARRRALDTDGERKSCDTYVALGEFPLRDRAPPSEARDPQAGARDLID